MNPKPKLAVIGPDPAESPAAMVGFGVFLGLTLLKFGNPPIMEKWVTPPADVFEFVLSNPWPIAWGYFGLAIVGLVALATIRRSQRPLSRLIILPLAWLVWQVVVGIGSINAELTKPVLAHFTACVGCFSLAFFFSKGLRSLVWILPGLLVAFLIVIAIGWQQHFGGLEQTRRYFFLYLYPKLKDIPPDYLKKLSSTRIFSTLFYPNALAGAILLLLPTLLQFVWHAEERFTRNARIFLISTIGCGALGCLYWSGSKGGWLLLMLLALLWILRLPFNPQLKRAIIGTVLVVGLAGFFWKYSGFFQKGATSVGARFDYWTAAVKSTLAHPIFGTGPGTFSITYQKLKPPDAEMARLAHNDYLQQASDSGLPGFLLYSAFITGALVISYPRCSRLLPKLNKGALQREETRKKPKMTEPDGAIEAQCQNQLWFTLWLGALGFALQSLMEFSLYIPALAWTAFAFLGLITRQKYLIPAENRPLIPAK